MNDTILGLQLESRIPEGMMPYCAIAIVKAFDKDGNESYAVVMTDDMTPVDGAGMLNLGQIYVNELLRKTFKVDKNDKSSKAK